MFKYLKKNNIKEITCLFIIILSTFLIKDFDFLPSLFFNVALFFTELANHFYEPISFFLGDFLTSRERVGGVGYITLMGIPYFIICLVMQYLLKLNISKKIKSLYLFLSLFFSQVEILLILRRKLKNLTDNELFLILVIGFSTMSSGVTILYKVKYLQQNSLALNVLAYSQIITLFLTILISPVFYRYLCQIKLTNLIKDFDSNDFLGMKGLLEILLGSFIGIVITVGLVRSSSYLLNGMMSVEPICLQSYCESSFFFTLLTRSLKYILTVVGFDVDSLKMAFVLSKSFLVNEKEAFRLLSQINLKGENSYIVLISLITNFINIYALGFSIGVMTYLVRRVDIKVIFFTLKAFFCAIIIKLLTTFLVVTRLLW